MAEGYQQAADHYGFNCLNCLDNCCQTLFYHHTYIEYFYLMEGVASLDDASQAALRTKAVAVCEAVAEIEGRGEIPRVMCPLNVDGLCSLYEYRPMICRLHGVPYDLQMPGRPSTRGEPCSEFSNRVSTDGYFPFDRTPLYQTMSGLEQKLRMEIRRSTRIRKTIAEMIAYDLEG